MMTFPTISAGTRANEPIGGYANFIAYCNALAAGVDSVTTTAAGAALKANNLSDLASASTARTNLGLGTMATATASDYLSKAGNLSGIADLAAARTNLGLGTMATETASQYAKLASANAFTIGQSIATSSANQVGLTIKGSASQAWNLVNYTDSSGVSVGGVLAGGQLNIPNGSLDALGFGFRGNGSYDYGLYGYSGGFIAAAAGTNLMTFTSSGPKFVTAIRPSGDDPAMVGLPIKLVAAQVANSVEVRNSSDSVLASITAAGLHRWNTASNEQTTVGAAGAATALPAAPTRYLKVVDSAGTTLVIPAYAAA